MSAAARTRGRTCLPSLLAPLPLKAAANPLPAAAFARSFLSAAAFARPRLLLEFAPLCASSHLPLHACARRCAAFGHQCGAEVAREVPKCRKLWSMWMRGGRFPHAKALTQTLGTWTGLLPSCPCFPDLRFLGKVTRESSLAFDEEEHNRAALDAPAPHWPRFSTLWHPVGYPCSTLSAIFCTSRRHMTVCHPEMQRLPC